MSSASIPYLATSVITPGLATVSCHAGPFLCGMGQRITAMRSSHTHEFSPQRDDAPPRSVLKTNAGEVYCLVFSPDGQMLATGGRSGTVQLWDVASAQEQATLAGHSGWVSGLAYSPDGETLGSASYDRTVKVWDVFAGLELATFPRTEAPLGTSGLRPRRQDRGGGRCELGRQAPRPANQPGAGPAQGTQGRCLVPGIRPRRHVPGHRQL